MTGTYYQIWQPAQLLQRGDTAEEACLAAAYNYYARELYQEGWKLEEEWVCGNQVFLIRNEPYDSDLMWSRIDNEEVLWKLTIEYVRESKPYTGVFYNPRSLERIILRSEE